MRIELEQIGCAKRLNSGEGSDSLGGAVQPDRGPILVGVLRVSYPVT